MFLRDAIRLMANANPNAVTNGLQLWLDGKDFTNSPQTTTWLDKSGNGKNGTASGFSYTTTDGNDGNGNVVFDGVNNKIDLGLFDLPKSFTLEFYINIQAFADRSIFGNWGSSSPSFLLSNNTNTIKLYIQNAVGVNFTLSGFGTLSVNTWYHCVITYDDTTGAYKIYLNSTNVSSGSISGNISRRTLTNPTHIGFKQDSSGYASFKLKTFRVYNRVLTGAEVLQNYNASK